MCEKAIISEIMVAGLLLFWYIDHRFRERLLITAGGTWSFRFLKKIVSTERLADGSAIKGN